MIILNLYVDAIKIIQYQIYQSSLGHANTSEMKVISSWLIDDNSFDFFWLYTVEEIINKVYESNLATAYETYREAVKQIVVLDFKA